MIDKLLPAIWDHVVNASTQSTLLLCAHSLSSTRVWNDGKTILACSMIHLLCRECDDMKHSTTPVMVMPPYTTRAVLWFQMVGQIAGNCYTVLNRKIQRCHEVFSFSSGKTSPGLGQPMDSLRMTPQPPQKAPSLRSMKILHWLRAARGAYLHACVHCLTPAMAANARGSM